MGDSKRLSNSVLRMLLLAAVALLSIVPLPCGAIVALLIVAET